MVALLRFESGVQEVFAVTVLPGGGYPDLINDDEKLLENSFVVPDRCSPMCRRSLPGPAEPTRRGGGVGRERGWRPCAYASRLRRRAGDMLHHRLFNSPMRPTEAMIFNLAFRRLP